MGDLLRLAFSREQAEAIRRLPAFDRVDPGFFDALPDLRFEGDVWAIPEGTVVFAGEPLLRVEAPLPQAQWVETILLASLGYPTLVASKAARVVEAAAGRPVYDFGARRGHGPQAGLLAARAAYLAGCAGTSHVEAARRLGIPCVGTMAHSWVQSFASESEAFAAYARAFPGATTLLVDTYDVEEGVREAARIEPAVQAVRIDSGDLGELARRTRSILDAHDRAATKILGSGDLDEHSIAALVAAGAPFDAFGVGTELITSRDAPALSMVYKLVELDGAGRVKLSPGKKTYPLAKQVFRTLRRRGPVRVRSGDPGGRVRRRRAAPQTRPPRGKARRAHSLDSMPSAPTVGTSSRGSPPRSSPGRRPAYPILYSDLLEDEAARLGVR